MSTFESLDLSGWATPVVLVLGHALWQGAVFVVVAEIVRAVGLVRTPEARYALSLVTLTALIAAPLLSVAGVVPRGLLPVAGHETHSPSTDSAQEPIAAWQAADPEPVPLGKTELAPPEVEPVGIAAAEVDDPPVLASAATPAPPSEAFRSTPSADRPVVAGVSGVSMPHAPSVGPKDIAAMPDRQGRRMDDGSALSSVVPNLLAVWLFGVGMGLVSLLGGGARLVRVVAAGVPWDGPDRQLFDRRWAARLGCPADRVACWRIVLLPTRAASSARLPGLPNARMWPDEAFATGLFRPTIVLPRTWRDELPEGVLHGVLLHEIAHLRRGDLWVILVERLVGMLLFFHPGVWWLRRRLREDRETCCDAWAADRLSDRVGYAMTLETIGRRREAEGRPRAAAAFRGGRPMRLLTRVRAVLTPAGRGTTASSLGGAVLVPLLTLLTIVFATGTPTSGPATADDDPKPGAARERSEAGEAKEAKDERRGETRESDRPRGDRDISRPEVAARYQELVEKHRASVRGLEQSRRQLAERQEQLDAELREQIERVRRDAAEVGVELPPLPPGLTHAGRPFDRPDARPQGPGGPLREDGPMLRPMGPGPAFAPGPPGPHDLTAVLREMRQELGRLREEVGDLRRRVDGGRPPGPDFADRPGPGGPDGFRPAGPREGDRPPGPPRDGARPPFGPREGDRPAWGPGDGNRPPGPPREGDRPRGDRPDGGRPEAASPEGNRPPGPSRDGDGRGPRDGGREGRPGDRDGRPAFDREESGDRIETAE